MQQEETSTTLRLPDKTTTGLTTSRNSSHDALEELEGQHGVRIIDIHSEYDSLRRALIAGEIKSGGGPGALDLGGRLAAGLELRLPQSIAAPPRRGVRSMSLPLERAMTMASASASSESVVETVKEESGNAAAHANGNATPRPSAVESAPSSPPALSYSKSSKSSTSSTNSDDELSDVGLAEKTSHFEDVQLEDEREDNNLPPASRPTLRRPTPKSFTLGDGDGGAYPRRRNGASPTTSPPFPQSSQSLQLQLQPRGNGVRSRYPSLHGAVDGVLRDQSLNLPRGGGRRHMQRAASSPTSPFMRQYPSTIAERTPSRSPSPGRFVSSPSALTGSTSTDALTHYPQQTLPQRKSSWQPGRKTIHELEAECNDDDEEVPDEAILENVPISPMPGQHLSLLKSPRTSSTSLSSLRSPTPSPHRRPSYANLHSANIPKHAKRPSAPPPRNGPVRSPRSPQNGRPPMMPHSATTGQFPPNRMNRQFRAKSWTEDLNEEARQLSQALFEYTGQNPHERKHHSMHSTPSSSPPRPDMKDLRSKTSVAELTIAELPTVPDMQKGNIMIDPLPISKEKEAVLTRTRPSWLPPKDQKEEKRHLKEFQQMMARASETERKRVLKEQENRENRVELQGSIARIWEQHVLPNWDHVIKEPRTRELWWRGVTPRNRGEVWSRAVGNELELSEASFHAALARAHTLEDKISDLPEEEATNSKEAAWFTAIARDVPSVFPETEMFAPGQPLHENLTNTLKAFAMYRSDLGYVYGTHLVAGIVCMLLPAPKAFVLLANLLNRPLPLAFLVHDQIAMSKAYDLTLQTLKYKFPRLHAHLTSEGLGLKAEEFLDPVFRCLFAYNLPLGHVGRVWDVYVFEGDKALIRAAVGVLGKLEGKLYGSKEEVLGLIGWMNENKWEVGNEEEFIEAVREAGKVDGRRTVSA